MILTYRILTSLLYPLLVTFIYFRKFLNKEHPNRFKEKIHHSYFNIKRKRDTKLIWFHAASIGEFKSIIPVIEELNKKKNNLEFLVTTSTLSSSYLAKEELVKFKNTHHRFFPLDIGFLMEKFLESWRPKNIFLVDSEIWPNLILKAKIKKIPLALLNARLTKKTFRRWMNFPNTAKMIFSKFDLCLSSNIETKKYLKKMSVKNVYFNGNIKLINKIDAKKIKNVNEKFLLAKRFWLAASTHKGEDLFCLKIHKTIKKKYKDIVTIIAPRHINRAEDIRVLSNNFKLKTQLVNKNDRIFKNKEIIIINSFGILQNYFKYAKSVFIGKSTLKKFENDGGQSPIDAAKLRCKVYHGPYVYNFEEIYKILKKKNITKRIKTYQELSNFLIKDLKKPFDKEKKISNDIEILGRKTLKDTMRSINNFIK